MGNFKIEVEAVGGHGFSRETQQGSPIPYETAHENDPDRMSFEFVKQLREKGCNVTFAELTHWPDQQHIVDNLMLGTRGPGDFAEPYVENNGEPVLRFFQAVYRNSTQDPLERMYCHFARALVRRLPKSAERTLALRELLASYDNAVLARDAARLAYPV